LISINILEKQSSRHFVSIKTYKNLIYGIILGHSQEIVI